MELHLTAYFILNGTEMAIKTMFFFLGKPFFQRSWPQPPYFIIIKTKINANERTPANDQAKIKTILLKISDFQSAITATPFFLTTTC